MSWQTSSCERQAIPRGNTRGFPPPAHRLHARCCGCPLRRGSVQRPPRACPPRGCTAPGWPPGKVSAIALALQPVARVGLAACGVQPHSFCGWPSRGGRSLVAATLQRGNRRRNLRPVVASVSGSRCHSHADGDCEITMRMDVKKPLCGAWRELWNVSNYGLF